VCSGGELQTSRGGGAGGGQFSEIHYLIGEDPCPPHNAVVLLLNPPKIFIPLFQKHSIKNCSADFTVRNMMQKLRRTVEKLLCQIGLWLHCDKSFGRSFPKHTRTWPFSEGSLKKHFKLALSEKFPFSTLWTRKLNIRCIHQTFWYLSNIWKLAIVQHY
jgi:hypothetical protein